MLKEIFTQVLNNSIEASILAGIILLLTNIFRKKIGAKWRYFLWLLVALRLVMPFDIPSRLSIFNLPAFLDITHRFEVSDSRGNADQGTKGSAAVALGADYPDAPSLQASDANNLHSTDIIPANNDIAASASAAADSSDSGKTPDQPAYDSNHFNVKSLINFPFIWLIGLLILSLYALIIQLHFCQRIKNNGVRSRNSEVLTACLSECKALMGIKRDIQLVFSSEVKSPALSGLLHTKLLLPNYLEGNFSEKEYKHMFMHELSHYKSRDTITNALIIALQIIYWFNPVIWYAFFRLREECEIKADARALSFMKPEECEKYGNTLINLAAYFSGKNWPHTAMNFAVGKGPLKRRITMIKLYKKNSFKWSALAFILILIIGAAGLSSAKITANNTSNTSGNQDAVQGGSSGSDANVSGTDSSADSDTDNTGRDLQETGVNQPDSGIVNTDKKMYQLHSIDFINSQEGWAIKNEYDYVSGQQDTKLLKTSDGGKNWSEYQIDGSLLMQLVFTDQKNGWAVAQAGNTAVSDGSQVSYEILNTKNGGESWDIQLQKTAVTPESCDISFTDSNHGYVIISGILYLTADGGSSWTETAFSADGFLARHVSFSDQNTGWVIGDTGMNGNPDAGNQSGTLTVFHTEDGGKNWQQQFTRTYQDGPVGSIDINFTDAQTGWFLTSDLATWEGDLYYTSDAGKNWSIVNQIKCVRPTPTGLDFISPQVGWIPLNVGAGPIAGGFLSTKDGGKNFSYIGSDYEINSAEGVDFVSLQEGWAIGVNMNYGDYILHTLDGGQTWSQVYPAVSPITDISFVDSQIGYGLGQLSSQKALLYTGDGGKTWDHIYNFPDNRLPFRVSFIDKDTGWVLTATESGGGAVLKTTDGGHTWNEVKSDITQSVYMDSLYFKFLNKNDGILITRTADKIIYYRTSDGGSTWKVSEEAQSDSTGAYQFSFLSLNDGWKVTQPLGDASSPKISNTKDGSTWQETAGIGENRQTFGIDFISDNKGFILSYDLPYQAASKTTLMTTDNGGKSWETYALPDNLSVETYYNQVPLQFTDAQNGFLLTRLGLLKTTDSGKTWSWTN